MTRSTAVKDYADLVVLRGGGSDGFWYKADKWQALRLSAERMGGEHNETGTLAYSDAGFTEPHPTLEGVHGDVWQHAGSPVAPAAKRSRIECECGRGMYDPSKRESCFSCYQDTLAPCGYCNGKRKKHKEKCWSCFSASRAEMDRQIEHMREKPGPWEQIEACLRRMHARCGECGEIHDGPATDGTDWYSCAVDIDEEQAA